MINTLSKCFLYIAVMCPLILANFYFAFIYIESEKWHIAVLNIIAVVIGIIGIVIVYKITKRIENKMCDNIRTVMNLQAFDLLGKVFAKHPDFNPNGFGGNPKDKEDEVATDK